LSSQSHDLLLYWQSWQWRYVNLHANLAKEDHTSSIELQEAMHRWVIPPNTKVLSTWAHLLEKNVLVYGKTRTPPNYCGFHFWGDLGMEKSFFATLPSYFF
jgi:hypothetical protein